MIFPSAAGFAGFFVCTSTRLEYRPINSAAIVFTTVSPISLVHWKSKNRMRSSGSVRTSNSRPPVKCLRSSMQNEGGVCGFSNVSFVRHARAEPLRAERNRRGLSVRVRRLSTTSSRVGSNILSILASASAADSSFAHSARAAASKAIVFSFFRPGQSISSRTRPAAVSPARYHSRRRYFTKHTAPAHTALWETPKKSSAFQPHPSSSDLFPSAGTVVRPARACFWHITLCCLLLHYIIYNASGQRPFLRSKKSYVCRQAKAPPVRPRQKQRCACQTTALPRC